MSSLGISSNNIPTSFSGSGVTSSTYRSAQSEASQDVGVVVSRQQVISLSETQAKQYTDSRQGRSDNAQLRQYEQIAAIDEQDQLSELMGVDLFA